MYQTGKGGGRVTLPDDVQEWAGPDGSLTARWGRFVVAGDYVGRDGEAELEAALAFDERPWRS